MSDNILKQVNNYYSQKIIKNGATPQGVDWNSTESQNLRFEVLSNVVNTNDRFSVLDYGCGFGSMFEYFKQKYSDFTYTGFDISQQMIDEAVKIHLNNESSRWLTSINLNDRFDYIIASGIFNVKLETPDSEWLNYIIDTLNKLNNSSTKGFSFNILTKYSDKEYMKDYLYYADPLYIFDYCKLHFSKSVALLHDYELYEFTIVVRK
jgi:cyclopropane fatty-acyl-phospholipid synthase-like methyltransferase